MTGKMYPDIASGTSLIFMIIKLHGGKCSINSFRTEGSETQFFYFMFF